MGALMPCLKSRPLTGDVDVAPACRLDQGAILVGHAAGHGAEVEMVRAFLDQRAVASAASSACSPWTAQITRSASLSAAV